MKSLEARVETKEGMVGTCNTVLSSRPFCVVSELCPFRCRRRSHGL